MEAFWLQLHDNTSTSHRNLSLDLSTIADPYFRIQAVWWVLWLAGLEYLLLWLEGQRLPVFHDNLLGLVHGTLYELPRVVVRGTEYGIYAWVWEKYALLQPPGDTVLSFVLLVLLVDLGYYWFHRAAHEVSLLWAIHQVHHTSQDLTVTVGLRHSPLQRLFSWVFYLPLALLGVPPSLMLAHVQLNLLYQCWIHTSAVGCLGPLEYVLNTPTHHAVHHSSNLPYLDKNYGGVFIVWDRLFGTFQDPVPGQKYVYGILVHPESYSILYYQWFYLKHLVELAASMSSWKDGVSRLIKGPSWVPGAPWTGWEKDKIVVDPDREYMPVNATLVTHVYVLLHFLAALTLTASLASAGTSPGVVVVHSAVVVAALSSVSVVYEGLWYARRLELVRCAAALVLWCLLPPPATSVTLQLLAGLYLLSLCVWAVQPAAILGPKPHLS